MHIEETKALPAIEEHLGPVAATAADAIITIDDNGHIIFWNPAAKRMFGYSHDEILGKPLLLIVPKELHDQHQRSMKKVFETGKLNLTGKPVELTGLRKDGGTFPLEISMTLWKSSGKMFVTGIIRDITQRKQEEEQLHQTQKMASIGIFASGIAHEINNPNNAIMLNTAALAEIWEALNPVIEKFCRENKAFTVKGIGYDEIREKIPKLFNGIEGASKRIKTISRDLRDFAISEPLHVRKNIDINTIAANAVSLVHNLVSRSTDHFSVHYGDNLPGINGNPRKLEQVFINLLENAAQALTDKKSKICLSTSMDVERKHIVVKIEDEGVGISPECLEHVMDPFYTTKRDNGGTGLGLSVARAIVRDHGGSLDFESTPGKGTVAARSPGRCHPES